MGKKKVSETVATRFERAVSQPVVEQAVRIELSLEDAEDISAICRCIGGSPKGPRGAVDRLSHALHQANVIPNPTVHQSERDGIPIPYFGRKDWLHD